MLSKHRRTRRKTSNKKRGGSNSQYSKSDFGYFKHDGTVVVNHGGGGFFSCCSVILHEIIRYFNDEKKLPKNIDSTGCFGYYKNANNSNKDITLEYFEKYSADDNIKYTHTIDYNQGHQSVDYKKIQYKDICPFVRKYFSPSDKVKALMNEIEKKYIKTDYSNICTVFYRGNDKASETQIAPYEDFIEKANIVLKDNPSVQFLIQSDETEFIETFSGKFPSNSFYFKDEIRHMTKRGGTVNHVQRNNKQVYSKKYLAITILMGKAKHVICGSTNGAIWIMLYRENADNVVQFLNGNWI